MCLNGEAMAGKLTTLEERVEREMKLLRGASEPELDSGRSQRIKAAIRREALRLQAPAGLLALPRARRWLAVAAAVVLACGLGWQTRLPETSEPTGDAGELLSDWGAALDRSAAAAASLVSEPWLPDDWISPTDVNGELDALLEGFDRAFESGV